MDEAAIASSLLSKLPKFIPSVSAPEPAELSKPEVELVKPTNVPDELAAYRMMDYFGIEADERSLTHVKDKLGVIYEWGKEQAGSSDSLDIQAKIRELENRLGLTFRNDDRLDAMFHWIKLDTQRRQIEKEMALV